MFAILITEESMPDIIDRERAHLTLNDLAFLQTCIGKSRYFVSGFYDRRGRLGTWMMLPQHTLDKYYEYDNKIHTDWDQIVRKQPAPA